MSDETNPYTQAGHMIGGAIDRLVRDAGGTFTEQPIWPGAASRTMRPDPRMAVRAAIALHHAATRKAGDAVADARAAGVSWTDIAADLGFTDDTTGQPTIHDAWRFAAEHVLPGQEVSYDRPHRVDIAPYVVWTCNTCDATVLEYDPINGLSAQSGHLPGCVRYTAEQTAEHARWAE